RANSNQFPSGCIARLFESDVVIEFESLALLPFKRRKHQLIFSDRASEEHRHLGETHRRRVGHQIGHLPVKRAIDDYAQGTLAWVVFGNEKHGAPEIWIEHVGMSNQQRTSKTARERSVPQLTHVKLETAMRSRATRSRCDFARCQRLSQRWLCYLFLLIHRSFLRRRAAVAGCKNFYKNFVATRRKLV